MKYYIYPFLVMQFLLILDSCGGSVTGGQSKEAAENGISQLFENRFHLIGTILDEALKPVENARVTLETSITQTTKSDNKGKFSFPDVPASNGSIKFEVAGFYTEFVFIPGQQYAGTDTVILKEILMRKKTASTNRFLFGGDVGLGRRFLDPSDATPRNVLPKDNKDAVIRVSKVAEDSKEVFQRIKPLFEKVDFRTFNLESPVLDDPSTPHEDKEFAFFTLPESLEAFKWLQIDLITLANNHVYDYLESGLKQTLDNLGKFGINYTGAGINSEEALEPYRTLVSNKKFSIIAVTSVTGSKYDTGFTATAKKGGAAAISNLQEFKKIIRSERNNGQIPVTVLHSGSEYTENPTPEVLLRHKSAIEAGAELSIGHHTHVAQGFYLHNQHLIVPSLGNLALDQDRLETMISYIFMADFKEGSLEAARIMPIYIKKYQPRPLSGRLADRLIRKLGEQSDGVEVLNNNGIGVISLGKPKGSFSSRTKTLLIESSDKKQVLLDLRNYAGPGESLSGLIFSDNGHPLQFGRDYMIFGEFEDEEKVGDSYETSVWDLSSESRYLCTAAAHRGNLGMCSVRTFGEKSLSAIKMRNSVRIYKKGDSGLSLTFLGYFQGENAGSFNIKSILKNSTAEVKEVIGEIYKNPGGTFDWTMVSATVNFPKKNIPIEEAEGYLDTGLKFEVEQKPPERGKALLMADDLALISWEKQLKAGKKISIKSPNLFDFILLEPSPESYSVTLSFSRTE